jgi:ankyrin repeat protein
MEDSRRSFETGFELLQAGDADGLGRILQQDPAHAEARDSAGVSLLMHSLYRGRRDLAELIASKKEALDIFEAAALGRLDRVRQCLPDARSAINSRSKDGFTALHFACFFGQPDAARLLLERGAPVNARQQAGWVPIHAAAQNGDRPLVELLLQHGADPKLVNDQGKTSAMVAREKGHAEIAALLEH